MVLTRNLHRKLIASSAFVDHRDNSFVKLQEQSFPKSRRASFFASSAIVAKKPNEQQTLGDTQPQKSFIRRFLNSSIGKAAILLVVIMLSLSIRSRFESPGSNRSKEAAVAEWATVIRDWGYPGVCAVMVIEILAVVTCMVPVSALIEMSCGAVYGFTYGVAIISISKCTAASITMFLGRYVIHDFVRRQAESNPKFRALEDMATEEGWKLVALIRLSPLPAAVGNYGFALTDVAFTTYFVTTFVVTLLPISQMILFGISIAEAAESMQGMVTGNGKGANEAVSLLRSPQLKMVVTGIMIVLVGWIGRKAHLAVQSTNQNKSKMH